MRLPIRRVLEEKRRLTIPVVGGLVLNLALFAGVVLPLSARTRAAESQARTAAQQLQAAEREDTEARNAAERRDRTNTALKTFYKDVLPLNQTQARGATFLRMSQLAEQHNLEQMGRKSDVEVLVEDNGPGIEPHALDRIFERFYTDRPEQGFGQNSGLGLSISRQIVEAHRGAIRAENQLGPPDEAGEPRRLGARFIIRLPVVHQKAGPKNGQKG